LRLTSSDFEINALQLGIAFSGLSLKDVEHNYSGNTLLYNHISNQDFRLSFENQNGSSDFEIILEFDVLEDGNLRDMISLNDDFEQLSVGFDQHAFIDLDFQETSSVQDLEDISITMIGNELVVNFPNVHSEKVVIYDVQGKIITNLNPNSNLVKVDLSGLNEGMFFVSTIVNEKPFTRKVVLINN